MAIFPMRYIATRIIKYVAYLDNEGILEEVLGRIALSLPFLAPKTSQIIFTGRRQVGS